MSVGYQGSDDQLAIEGKLEELRRHFGERCQLVVVAVQEGDVLYVKTDVSAALGSGTTTQRGLQDLLAGAILEFLKGFPQLAARRYKRIGDGELS